MKQNKYLYLPFLVVILVSLLFLVSQIPTVKVEPKNLPIAIVNEDIGEMGQEIYDNLIENVPGTIKFIEYDSVSNMKKGMNEREAYGGLVIPLDFSVQLASLQTDTPEAALLKIYINEGMNINIAATAETMLQNITTQIGTKISGDMLEGLQTASAKMSKQITEQMAAMQAQADAQSMPPEVSEQLKEFPAMISPVQPNQVSLFAHPIVTETIKVNTVGELGTVPSALFITVWVSSLFGAMLFYMAGDKREFTDRKSQTKFQIVQSILPIIYGFFAGYAITLFSTWVLGFEFASFHKVALFVSIALTSFVYLVLAALVWLKIPSVPLFGILMFFGMPLIQMAPEMIPSFYRDFVLPWLPMRFLIEGLKEILFFGKGTFNHYSTILLSMAGISFVIVWMKNMISKKVTE